jgi:hypothetical protein
VGVGERVDQRADLLGQAPGIVAPSGRERLFQLRGEALDVGEPEHGG